MASIITWISVALIVAFFIYVCTEATTLRKVTKLIISSIKSEDILSVLSGTKLSHVLESYTKSLKVRVGGSDKTTTPSCEYFNETSISRAFKFNLRMLDAASGSMVGLGLLGTFLGLTVGIYNFDSSTASGIQASIQSLLEGMGTAFVTSLVGMTLSLAYTILIDKPLRKSFHIAIAELNKVMDDRYYIDEYKLIIENQQTQIDKLSDKICDSLNFSSKQIIEEIKDSLTYISESGERASVSNAIRVILDENEEQTKALKSFSTDLALELNNGFDETLSRQMQQRLIPLMESVDATTKAVVEHIDQMARDVSNPANNMIENVIADMKESLMGIMEEFKSTLSKNTSSELENLAITLGSATKAIAEFPTSMTNITEVLQLTISEVKKSISEISQSTATASSSAMQQMQEQIVFATTSISTALTEVKDVMSNITKTSEQSSKNIIEKMANSVADMNSSLQNTMNVMSETMEHAMESMTKDISGKQTDMLALQENITNTISDILQQTLLEVKGTVAEMSTTSSAVNTSVINRMEEQMTLYSNSFSDLMNEVKEVVDNIANVSQTSSNELIGNLSKSSVEMTVSLQQTIDKVATKLETSMQSITNELSDKQIEILALQEETMKEVRKIILELSETSKTATEKVLLQTDSLLSRFNSSIERVNTTNESVAGTMNLFQQAQNNIMGTTSHLQVVSGDMKNATELFRKGQSDYIINVEKMQSETKNRLDDIMDVLASAGDTTEEYAQKFEIIRSGLGQIFTQIQNGLTEYSSSVRTSLQKYLEVYSANLTNTTDALASTIQQQNEMVEMLVDTVNRRR